MNFRLEKVSANKALVKFSIVNDAKEPCGSVSVTPAQEADLLKHWRALYTTGQTYAEQNGGGATSRRNARHGRQPKPARPPCVVPNMDGKTGLCAAINLAVFCENELAMVVLALGPLSESGAHPALDATLELAGEHLSVFDRAQANGGLPCRGTAGWRWHAGIPCSL